MSMGYGANLSVVAKIEDLRLMNFLELKELEDLILEIGTTFDELAQGIFQDDIAFYCFNSYSEDDEDALSEQLTSAYDNFCNAFKERTGVAIFLSYHNSEDDGSIYDDVNGGFFELNYPDVYEITNNAKKLQENLPFEIETYVSFG